MLDITTGRYNNFTKIEEPTGERYGQQGKGYKKGKQDE